MNQTTLRLAPLWLSLVAAVLLGAHLDRYPAPWFDEGLNSSAAAMLAGEGLYALPDSSGPSVMDARIQTGPTVVVPVAILFKMLGPALLPARLVVVAFALAALALYWRVARRVFDRQTALAAAVCLLAGNPEPFASFVYLGRQMLGEVPAFALVLAGLLATLNGWSHPSGGRRRAGWAVAAGFAWGAAIVTKSQVFVLLPAALALVCAADLLYYHRRAWPTVGLSAGIGLACVAGWYAVQYLAVGRTQFLLSAQLAREGFELHIAGINLVHMHNAAGVIWRAGFLLWGVPGLLWGLYLARTRDEDGLRQALLLAVPLVGLAWWTMLSIGWSRYAFYSFAMLPMWTANALIEWLRPRLHAGWRPWAGVIASTLLAVPLAAGAAGWYSALASPPANGFESMRQYLRDSLPPRAVVDTWEWELSIDATSQLRHPSTSLMYDAIRGQFSRRPPVRVRYAAASQPPLDYVLVGPFARWIGYFEDLPEDRSTRVAFFPPYTLYRIRRPNP